jgi:hypothetical protein
VSIPVFRVTVWLALAGTERMEISSNVKAVSRYDALLTEVTRIHDAIVGIDGSEDDFELVGVRIEAVVNGG